MTGESFTQNNRGVQPEERQDSPSRRITEESSLSNWRGVRLLKNIGSSLRNDRGSPSHKREE
jgi:hypothetical protein